MAFGGAGTVSIPPDSDERPDSIMLVVYENTPRQEASHTQPFTAAYHLAPPYQAKRPAFSWVWSRRAGIADVRAQRLWR